MTLPTVISLNKELKYDFNAVEFDCPTTVTDNLTVSNGNLNVANTINAGTLQAVAGNVTTLVCTQATLQNSASITGNLVWQGNTTAQGTLSLNGVSPVNIVLNGAATFNYFRMGRTLWLNFTQPITSVSGGNPYTFSYGLSSLGSFTFMKGLAYYHSLANSVVPFTGHLAVDNNTSTLQVIGQVTGNQTLGFVTGLIILSVI